MWACPSGKRVFEMPNLEFYTVNIGRRASKTYVFIKEADDHAGVPTEEKVSAILECGRVRREKEFSRCQILNSTT